MQIGSIFIQTTTTKKGFSDCILTDDSVETNIRNQNVLMARSVIPVIRIMCSKDVNGYGAAPSLKNSSCCAVNVSP